MTIKTLTKLAVLTVLATFSSVQAVTVGASRLIGTIIPGTPADPDNEQEMVRFLVAAYNTDPTARALGNNPADPQNEAYFLNPGLDVPAGPLALPESAGRFNLATSNTTLDLGTGGFTYIVAKFGQDSEAFYLGGLTGEITLNNLTGNQNGLSGYTLFNPGTTRVPDGGATVALLGAGLLGLGMMRRKIS
jgi:hypothetical protein